MHIIAHGANYLCVVQILKLEKMETIQLTNLYQVPKTLRFELVPEEKTREKFDAWMHQTNDDAEPESENFFYKDMQVAEAYPIIKLVLDKIHEKFITISLSSKEAKEIDFSLYCEQYKKDKNEIADVEEKLRLDLWRLFSIAGKYYKEKIEGVVSKEIKNIKKPYDYLSCKEMIKYIKAYVNDYSQLCNIEPVKLEKYLDNFKGFTTYLQGYNENRANYYALEDKSTSIVSRIVSDNLPTFCNNVIQFMDNKDVYLSLYTLLNERNIITQIKDDNGVFKELTPIEEKIFNIGFYNYCLTQKEIEDYNKSIGEYNELINLYNQQNQKEKKGVGKIKEFRKLYKQIGCGKRKTWFVALKKDRDADLTTEEQKTQNIYSVEKLLKTVNEAGEKYFKDAGGSENDPITSLPQFVLFLRNCCNWDGIYWSKAAVETISRKYFASGVFTLVLEKLHEQKGAKSASITYDQNREFPIQLRDAVELTDLFDAINCMKPEFVFKPAYLSEEVNGQDSSAAHLVNLLCDEIECHMKYFLENAQEIMALQHYKDEKNFDDKEDNTILKLKEWFDSATDALRIIRYFSVRKNKMKGSVANPVIEQGLFNLLNDENVDWFGWYDLIRTYLTKKIQDDVKENTLKLNFGMPNFLDGFTDSYSESDNGTQYGGYLFRRKNHKSNEYEYYLGVSKKSKLFRCHLRDTIQEEDKSEYERLDYYQIKSNSPSLYPDNYGEIKKAIQSKVEELTRVNKEKHPAEYNKINKVNKNGDITPGELYKRLSGSTIFSNLLNESSLCQLADETINVIKAKCGAITRLESINLIKDNEYHGLKGLFEILRDIQVACQSKVFTYFHVDKNEFEVHNGKDLFMFRISNKDLSYSQTYSDGKRKAKQHQKENLHTLFFRALMHEDGYGDIVDIGSGSVYFRKPAFTYDDEILKKGHHYERLKNKFTYPIISKKRFSEYKYLLHLSVVLNYRANKKLDSLLMNNEINEVFGTNENMHFIGIDRGEKHLVYSCTINSVGNIVGCKHYDIINRTDYVKKLEERAAERVNAKKNWQEQEKIKDLKNGYISHVIHELMEEAIKDADGKINPHAYIVLEDLSMGFTQGRQKIEKQTYRTLETALASKMNFIVDKAAREGDLGSVSNALQLTPLINTYSDIENKKQFGVMLYTRANYTSVTDPATGWRKTVYIKSGSDSDVRKQILENFSDIRFDGKDYYFEYTEQNVGKTWRMYSSKDGKSLHRYQFNQVKGNEQIKESVLVDVNAILDALFANFDKEQSLLQQIEDGAVLKKIHENKTAWQSLIYALNLIQQIRNSGEKGSVDDNFLLSPVRNENGVHFDTRNHINNGVLSAIVDADANGAYNIARKGLIMIAHIKQCKAAKDTNLFISDREWDMWLLDRKKWQEELPQFSMNKPIKKSTKTKK